MGPDDGSEASTWDGSVGNIDFTGWESDWGDYADHGQSV